VRGLSFLTKEVQQHDSGHAFVLGQGYGFALFSPHLGKLFPGMQKRKEIDNSNSHKNENTIQD